MAKRSDADLVQEALDLALKTGADEMIVQILKELRHRTTAPTGVQKFITAWTQGRLARQDGVPLDACPYVERDPAKRTFSTAYRKAWIRGWQGMDKGFGRSASLRRASIREMLRRHRVGVAV